MNNKLKIWCTYHNKSFIKEYNLKEDDFHSLFNSNNINLKEYNINYANTLLNEFVTMYYVWKNKKYSKFVGFEHYRRRFNNIKNIEENLNDICVYGSYIDFNGEDTLKKQYLSTLPNQIFYDVLEILNNKYGNNNKYSIYLETSNKIFWNECYIMKYENFEKMMSFLWDILTNLDNNINGNNFDIESYKKYYNEYEWYNIRVGHIIERLISCWIFCNYDIKNIIHV